MSIGLVSYIFYSFFAHTIIGALFGHKYFAVLPYLGLASIFGTFYSLINFMNTYFLAKKSAGALILPALCVPYIVCFFLFEKSFINVMNIDIYFCVGILIAYCLFSLRSNKLFVK